MSRSFERSSACPSAFPSSVATACLTLSALLDAMIDVAPRATACCATANPMPDEPPSTVIRFLENSPSFSICCFCVIAPSFFVGLQPLPYSNRLLFTPIRLMHNCHSLYASRETATSRFEPLDRICGDRRGEKRHKSVQPPIAQSTGGQPRPSARAFHVSGRVGGSFVFRV